MGILADMRAALDTTDRSGGEWNWRIGHGARRAVMADLHQPGNETVADWDERHELKSLFGLELIYTNEFEGWALENWEEPPQLPPNRKHQGS